MNTAFLSSPSVFFSYLQKFNGEDGEPFTLTVTNSSPSVKSFYLSQGLNYSRGFETSGQLRTGSFPAIGEKSTDPPSLTASTPNSIPIEQFIAFVQQNPTYTFRIQSTSTEPNAQIGQSITQVQQGMIKNEAPVITPLRKYTDGNQFNLQFQNYGQPRIFSAQDTVTMPVAGNSTLTLDIYPQASVNQRAQLQSDVSKKTALKDVLPSVILFKPGPGPAGTRNRKSVLPKILLAAAAILIAVVVLRRL